MENQKSKRLRIFILFGRTQTCKSSIIKYLSNGKVTISVGDHLIRKSTTRDINGYIISHPDLFDGEEILLIDTVGYADSQLNFTNNDIRELIEVNLMKFCKDASFIDGIIVTESLTNTTSQVASSLENLVIIFGENVKNSIIYLGTKFNSKGNLCQVREATVIEDCKTLKIKHGYMNFLTPYTKLKETELPSGQIKTLSEKLAKLDPLPLESLQEKKLFVENLAEEIQKELTLVKDEKIEYRKSVLDRFVKKFTTTEVTVYDEDRVLFFTNRTPRKVTLQIPYDHPILIEAMDSFMHLNIQVPPMEMCRKFAMLKYEKIVRAKIQPLMGLS